jgi:hypothetical protein
VGGDHRRHEAAGAAGCLKAAALRDGRTAISATRLCCFRPEDAGPTPLYAAQGVRVECPVLACNSYAAWMGPIGHQLTFESVGRNTGADWVLPLRFDSRETAVGGASHPSLSESKVCSASEPAVQRRSCRCRAWSAWKRLSQRLLPSAANWGSRPKRSTEVANLLPRSRRSAPRPIRLELAQRRT